jgi:polyisoprenoid-binding protein YceI
LDTEYSGTAKSPFGHSSAGFAATTTINRKDWNLEWNVALETGGWLVGDEIKISIEIEIIKVEEPQPEAIA